MLIVCCLPHWHSGQMSGDEVLLVRLEDDIINPVTAEYIINSIELAEKENAHCIVIQLDTPGGLLNATRAIVKKILNARVPVIVYVSPGGSRAASAGVFITLSAHIAAMAPSTNIGAAHPVTIGGGSPDKSEKIKELLKNLKKETPGKKTDDDKEQPVKKEEETSESTDVMGDKIVNDTVAWIRTIARTRGKNEKWAEESVRLSVSIPEHEALKLNVIDIVAVNLGELLLSLNGRTITTAENKKITFQTEHVRVREIPMNFRQRFLNVLANPNLAYILMMLGFYGLLYEFTHPGIGFPGIAGTISLILAFYSMQTLPTNYAGLALIILAILLFVAEVFVVSFGLLALGGVVSMVLGSFILFDSPADYLRVSLNIIIPLVLSTAFIIIFLVSLAVKSYRKKSITGREGMMNSGGTVFSAIDGTGKVFVKGEIWDAVSDEKIEKDEKIEVMDINGMILKVKRQK